MKLSSLLRDRVNAGLAKLNLRLETLTATRHEQGRIGKLRADGYFDRPAFPLLPSFASFDGRMILDGYAAHRADCQQLLAPPTGPLRYNPSNEYFAPADACPTYLVARLFGPKLWLEVGSGNSTRVVRQAIEDGRLGTTLVCIDPEPRSDVIDVADEFIRSEVQARQPADIAGRLDSSDVLFIDSSHTLKAGGDVLHLLLDVIPRLKPGVLVHIHDVFLPFDYPGDWMERGWNWSENYLVQAMLQFGGRLEVIWPGYYVQKCRPEIALRLEGLNNGMATSLWLRVVA